MRVDRLVGGRRRAGVLAAIALGGAGGGLARYGVDQVLPDRNGFPWATFAVNVTGAFVLAALLVLVLERWPPNRYVRPLLAVGFLGAYTTFSTWLVAVDRLVEGGRVALAAGYLLGTLAAGVAATALGLFTGRTLAGGRRAAGR